jgi:hypothetical protein
MNYHDISDGTYPATVATHTDSFIALISPTCDPVVLIVSEDIFSCTEISVGDSITVTISDGRFYNVEKDID